LASQDHEDRLD